MQVRVNYSDRNDGTSTACLTNVTTDSFQAAVSDAGQLGLFAVRNEDNEFLVMPLSNVYSIHLEKA